MLLGFVDCIAEVIGASSPHKAEMQRIDVDKVLEGSRRV